jgi:hypothetical protein
MLSMFGVLWIDMYDSMFQQLCTGNNKQPDHLSSKSVRQISAMLELPGQL